MPLWSAPRDQAKTCGYRLKALPRPICTTRPALADVWAKLPRLGSTFRRLPQRANLLVLSPDVRWCDMHDRKQQSGLK
jgi:hypothetical protein